MDGLPPFKFDATNTERQKNPANPKYVDSEGQGVFIRCGMVWEVGRELGHPYCGFSSKKERKNDLGAIVFSSDTSKVHVVIPLPASTILFGCSK